MKIPIFQIDAFADELFRGNPAAVCPLESWLSDSIMQEIAAENNLSETAFFVREGEGYRLRWFTPTVEADLCGHATLATAFVLKTELGEGANPIRFQSRSGLLTVRSADGRHTLDFPCQNPEPCKTPTGVLEALGLREAEVLSAKDLLVVVESEALVAGLRPDFSKLIGPEYRGVIVTAQGDSADFVSRFFAPSCGINEDPVTGSAHCILTPYWAKRLNKSELLAHQVSSRGGQIHCTLKGDRVELTGTAVKYMDGTIRVGN